MRREDKEFLNTLIESKYLKDNFMIEDNGFNISGGEKQKIILARSLLKDSNYIILDEALSEVDINEEKQILNKIFDVYKEKTIIYGDYDVDGITSITVLKKFLNERGLDVDYYIPNR